MRGTDLRAFVFVMLMAPMAAAQTQITTGVIQGTVIGSPGGFGSGRRG